jgi:hypothetical protein
MTIDVEAAEEAADVSRGIENRAAVSSRRIGGALLG